MPSSILRFVAASLLLAGVLALSARSAQSPGPTPAERHRAAVADRFGKKAWTRGAVREGLVNELALAGWTRSTLDADAGCVARSYRRAELSETAAASVLVESFVSDGPDGAHERLLDWLAGVESTTHLPSTAELGLVAGDVGFVGRSGAGPGALAWIAFVRGNVAVRVSALDARREPTLPLGAVAEAVDAQVRASAETKDRAPRAPEIRALTAEKDSVAAGEVVVLDVAVADPANGRPLLAWNVAGPGQGYVEARADGRYELHATGPGRATVVLEVTGSTGTTAKRELALTIEPERERRR